MTEVRITSVSDVCGGQPVIAGTRMRVVDVVTALANGDTEDELLADFPFLSRDDIRACLAYAADAAGRAPFSQAA